MQVLWALMPSACWDDAIAARKAHHAGHGGGGGGASATGLLLNSNAVHTTARERPMALTLGDYRRLGRAMLRIWGRGAIAVAVAQWRLAWTAWKRCGEGPSPASS